MLQLAAEDGQVAKLYENLFFFSLSGFYSWVIFYLCFEDKVSVVISLFLLLTMKRERYSLKFHSNILQLSVEKKKKQLEQCVQLNSELSLIH